MISKQHQPAELEKTRVSTIETPKTKTPTIVFNNTLYYYLATVPCRNDNATL